MMRQSLAILVFSTAAFAADQDFNGRWDITAHTTPRPRAYWLEITDAGTPNPSGWFVSAYNGDRNKIDSISIKNGELTFSFNPPPSRNGKQQRIPAWHARFAAGKLEGSFGVEGGPSTPFTGVKAPV